MTGEPMGSFGQGALRWVPQGTATSVAGRSIGGGMLYVGSRALAGDGWSVEPALIDPSLSVDWKRPDLGGSTMGYWPSYREITPGARAAYLMWLLE
ncbi:MAG: TerB N-terminal domain-containing protein, partial [Mycobacteriales bacterium]